MYVVVIFQSSLVIKVIPIDFIKEYNPIDMVNNAVDQSRTHIVFYSNNFNECPDFSLDIKTEFDDKVPGCYEVRFLKFFDDYKSADDYSSQKREILPKSYRSKGRKCTDYDFASLHLDDEKDSDVMSAEKMAERQKIQHKMNALDKEYFDLDDSEVEEFQQLLYDDDNDGSIEWLDEKDDFPQPFNFKSEILHLEKITEKPDEETIEERLNVSTENEPTSASKATANTDGTSERPNDGLLDKSNGASFDVLIGNSNKKSIEGQIPEYSKDIEPINAPSSDVNDYETIEKRIQNPIEESIGKPNEKHVMMELYTVKGNIGSLDDEIRVVESACSILAREKDARGSSLVDNSKNTPTAGKKASIPGLIQIIKSKVVENPSPSSSLRTTNTKSQSEFGGRKCIDKSSIDYVKSILHLHFPEEYVATFNPETTMFDFGGIASVKFSIVKTIIGWNIQPAFNNILYDDRFVGILLTYVVGKENLANNYLPKEQIRFIRMIFSQRVKNDQRRSIRFGEYIHRKVTREMENKNQ